MNHLLLLVLGTLFHIKYGTSNYQTDPWYPRYHLASRDGFMNDPNGLINYDGYYHAFYQHSPGNSTIQGVKYWAHARSTDMLHWEHLEEALSPSIKEDIDGVYSGSAIEGEQGELNLLYTGVSTVNNRIHQVQCLATSTDKGLTYKKLGQVLESDKYFSDFRDPKVWKEGNDYYIVLAAMNSSNNVGRGQVMLYKSKDLQHWEEQGVFAGPIDNFGFMWECPDFFTLDNKQILVFSVEQLNEQGIKIHETGYIVGSWKAGEPQFKMEQEYIRLDEGLDFYAAQSFLAKDGRRIMLSWMNMWETPFPEAKNGWIGTFTLPRELTLNEDGKILSAPIKEVESLRGKLRNYRNQHVSANKTFLLDANSVLTKELDLTWNLKSSNGTSFGIQLTGADKNEGFFLFVDSKSKKFVMRRNYPTVGFPTSERSISIEGKKSLHTRIFFDRSTVEVFVDHGEVVLSSRIYPNEKQKDLSLFTVGGEAYFKNIKQWNIVVKN